MHGLVTLGKLNADNQEAQRIMAKHGFEVLTSASAAKLTARSPASCITEAHIPSFDFGVISCAGYIGFIPLTHTAREWADKNLRVKRIGILAVVDAGFADLVRDDITDAGLTIAS